MTIPSLSIDVNVYFVSLISFPFFFFIPSFPFSPPHSFFSPFSLFLSFPLKHLLHFTQSLLPPPPFSRNTFVALLSFFLRFSFPFLFSPPFFFFFFFFLSKKVGVGNKVNNKSHNHHNLPRWSSRFFFCSHFYWGASMMVHIMQFVLYSFALWGR